MADPDISAGTGRPATAPPRRERLDGAAIAAVVGCCFLWGLNQVAAKVALPEIPSLWQAAARSVFGAVLVFVWARWRGVALFERDGSSAGGLLAGTLFGAEFLCIFLGLEDTTASRMAVFIYISPFVVALGMPFIARAERLTPWQFGGLALAFAGVAWAFADGFSHRAGPDQWRGDALGILAGVLWGGTTLAIRGSALARVAPEKMLLWQLAVSGVLLTGAALLRGVPPPASVSTLAAASLVFQVVVVTTASYLVWFGLIQRYPATMLASFTLLTPLFGLALGAGLLGEPVTPRLVAAAAAVALGIVGVNRMRRRG